MDRAPVRPLSREGALPRRGREGRPPCRSPTPPLYSAPSGIVLRSREGSMFSRHDLAPLLKYAGNDSSPVLSLYLDVDLSRPANRNRGILVEARGLVAGLREEVGGRPEASHLEQDAARVEAFLEEYQSSGKSLIVFCDASEDFLWHRTLPVVLPRDARYQSQPHVRPLFETLDEHERYGVILLDRQQARFFSIFFGEIEEHIEAFATL